MPFLVSENDTGKGIFTPSESEKDQRSSEKRLMNKPQIRQRKFSLSLGVNEWAIMTAEFFVVQCKHFEIFRFEFVKLVKDERYHHYDCTLLTSSNRPQVIMV